MQIRLVTRVDSKRVNAMDAIVLVVASPDVAASVLMLAWRSIDPEICLTRGLSKLILSAAIVAAPFDGASDGIIRRLALIVCVSKNFKAHD